MTRRDHAKPTISKDTVSSHTASGDSVRDASSVGVIGSEQAVWLDARWRGRVRRNLLDWFAENARNLPWRSDPRPYPVWVSEIMLQQTQVATVIPYFQRWMSSFPTITDLARADEEEIMRLWEGLGYYRRARSLHAAAKQIVAEHDGEFPQQYQDVLALPGIGRYTAGAILSISGDQRLPILEGNTQRVFSRWIGSTGDPKEKSTAALLWDFAETILPRKRCGSFNQAAMELGALLCTPTRPDCDACPVMRQCRAASLGEQANMPGKSKKIRYENRTEYALVIRATRSGEDAYLLRQLPEGVRWSGLWDFPRPTDDAIASAEDATDWLSKQLSTDIEIDEKMFELKHAVTRYRITLNVFRARPVGSKRFPRSVPTPWKWIPLKALNELPMSVTGRKIVESIIKS